MTHIKRYNAPKTWKLLRKAHTWVTVPRPGGHERKNSIALSVALRDLLNIVENQKGARYLLHNEKVLVNGVARKSTRYPIGLMDILTLPDIKKSFEVIVDTKGRLMLKEVKSGDFRYSRIENKTLLEKGKIQLNLFGGVNLRVDKNAYQVGDTLKLNVKDNTIKGHIEFKPGASVFILGGSHAGETAKLVSIEAKIRPAEVILKNKEGDEFRTRKIYAYAIE